MKSILVFFLVPAAFSWSSEKLAEPDRDYDLVYTVHTSMGDTHTLTYKHRISSVDSMRYWQRHEGIVNSMDSVNYVLESKLQLNRIASLLTLYSNFSTDTSDVYISHPCRYFLTLKRGLEYFSIEFTDNDKGPVYRSLLWKKLRIIGAEQTRLWSRFDRSK